MQLPHAKFTHVSVMARNGLSCFNTKAMPVFPVWIYSCSAPQNGSCSVDLTLCKSSFLRVLNCLSA